MKTGDARRRFEKVAAGDRQLAIIWCDGHESRYPSIWLLQACSCPACGSTESAVRHVRLTQQPARPKIRKMEISGQVLTLDWGEGHRSTFEAAWLRAHCLSVAERRQRKVKPQIWGREVQDRIPAMDYAEVAADPDRHLAFLETLRDLGFFLLRQVPKERERTEEVAALVGSLRLTNYGIFELEAKPSPEIVGDMALALALHTDEPYRIEPPAITLFHVLEQSAEGGESTLADGFRLAGILRQEDPEAFATLCSLPARFHRTLQEGRAFEMQAPIISLDSDGEVTGLRLLDRGMAPVDAPPDQVEAFYDALRSLLALVYDGEGQITVKLQAGEMLVFNNQRILHGRTAFDPAQGRRHVRSCHVDLDEFHSRLRTAYRSRGREEAWMTLSAGVRV